MTDRTLFISSCSRRELARRRPTRSGAKMPIAIVLLVLVVAAAVVLAAAQGVI